MHHLYRYYGTPELGKCNDKEPKEGESETDWTKPTHFVGEFVDCGKPTGRVWLEKGNALKAAREAIETYFGFKGEKLEKYFKENVPEIWEHFDVNNEGKIDVERGP